MSPSTPETDALCAEHDADCHPLQEHYVFFLRDLSELSRKLEVQRNILLDALRRFTEVGAPSDAEVLDEAAALLRELTRSTDRR